MRLRILTSPKLNPNFWLKGVDFSCASPWNSARGRLGAGTAVTKRHILYSNHFIGNQPVLIYCICGGDGGTGNSIHAYRREIHSAMDELCPGYTLEVFDFEQVKSGKRGGWREGGKTINVVTTVRDGR